MKKNHDEACYLLGEMVAKMFDQLPALTNNYRYIAKAMQRASDEIVYEGVEEYRQMADNPAYERYFRPSSQELADGSYRSRVSGVISKDLENALRRTAAASLVFAHSVFETCVYDLLRMSVEAGPEDWLPLISKKQFTAGDVTTQNVDDLLFRLIEKHLRSLERQSVAEKIDTLFALIAPPPNRREFPQYVYDRARIQQIDAARHAVVHSDPLSYDPTRLKEDLDYLMVSILWLGNPVIDKYDLSSKTRPLPG